LSGATHYEDVDFDEDDDKKTVGSASTARNSATHIPYRDSEAPPVPTLPWNKGPEQPDEPDLEKQESEQEPDNEQEEEKDPNLVDWDGPDDPVRDILIVRSRPTNVSRRKTHKTSQLRKNGLLQRPWVL